MAANIGLERRVVFKRESWGCVTNEYVDSDNHLPTAAVVVMIGDKRCWWSDIMSIVTEEFGDGFHTLLLVEPGVDNRANVLRFYQCTLEEAEALQRHEPRKLSERQFSVDMHTMPQSRTSVAMINNALDQQFPDSSDRDVLLEAQFGIEGNELRFTRIDPVLISDQESLSLEDLRETARNNFPRVDFGFVYVDTRVHFPVVDELHLSVPQMTNQDVRGNDWKALQIETTEDGDVIVSTHVALNKDDLDEGFTLSALQDVATAKLFGVAFKDIGVTFDYLEDTVTLQAKKT